VVSAIFDFLKADAKYVVQKKGDAFQRQQPFLRHHERPCHVIQLVLLGGLDDGVWQPRPDTGFAAMPRVFPLVQAKPGHDSPQKRFRLPNSSAIGFEPARKRVLRTSSASAHGS
jgi:hypothetical protein